MKSYSFVLEYNFVFLVRSKHSDVRVREGVRKERKSGMFLLPTQVKFKIKGKRKNKENDSYGIPRLCLKKVIFKLTYTNKNERFL